MHRHWGRLLKPLVAPVLASIVAVAFVTGWTPVPATTC